MSKIDNVAATIVERLGPLDPWRLQKLVYYCQAWHLVWEGTALFPDRFEAWASGPVAPALYRRHRGHFTKVRSWPQGASKRLKSREMSTVLAVVRYYGDKSNDWLGALVRQESPWQRARRGVSEIERGYRKITKKSMAKYYGRLARHRS